GCELPRGGRTELSRDVDGAPSGDSSDAGGLFEGHDEPCGLPAPGPPGLPDRGPAAARPEAERGPGHQGGVPGGRLRAVRAWRSRSRGDQGIPGVRVPLLDEPVRALRAAPGGCELRPQGLLEDGSEGLAARVSGEDELSLDGFGPWLRE